MNDLAAAYRTYFGVGEQADAPARPRALRILICGAVDDGKSTLIGRLAAEAGGLTEDQQLALAEASRLHGTTGGGLDYSLVTDGLEAEREQNITIDVAYRYLATQARDFVIVDTPGHEQYTANMATGASQCDVGVILVDAVRGLRPQTFRHATICGLLGIRHIVLAVNKMDAVDYSEAAYQALVEQFATATAHLQLTVVAVPIAARHGVNILALGVETPWYRGEALLPQLEAITVETEPNYSGLRLPIQGIVRTREGERVYLGTVVSGAITEKQVVRVALSGAEATVNGLIVQGGPGHEARAGDAVAFTLQPDLELGRGGIVASRRDGPSCTDLFSAFVIWFGRQPLFAGRDYEMRLGTATSPVTVTALRGKLDVVTGTQVAATRVERDEVAICHLATPSKIALDPHTLCRPTGRFILIDRVSGDTVAAGLVRHALDRGGNLTKQNLTIDRRAREDLLGQKAGVIWFTGLSGAGKSTIADALERRLHQAGKLTVLLDGDNIRLGLNRDLGFTEEDRVENLRRVAEVAKLMADAGLIVLCCFISPFARDRAMVRERLTGCPFFEVHVDASLETCERRDPKGLYAKARRGEIRNFTGIDSAYEVPMDADLVLDTNQSSAEELADGVVSWLAHRGMLA